MFTHIMIGSNDLERARNFYDATLVALGGKLGEMDARGRLIYVHVARGAVQANDVALEAGDALKLSDTEQLQLKDGRDAEVLVFDLPNE